MFSKVSEAPLLLLNTNRIRPTLCATERLVLVSASTDDWLASLDLKLPIETCFFEEQSSIRFWPEEPFPWCWNEIKLEKRLPPFLPPVTSAHSLYRNVLLLLSARRRPSFTAVVDYHEIHTRFRSTKSYNLLMSHALRNASYGTVLWILKSMAELSLRPNKETEKLKLRWLMQMGLRDDAWRFAVQRSDKIPEHIWLELFRTSKRGANRRLASAESNEPLTTDHLITLLKHRPLPQDGCFPSRVVFVILQAFMRVDRFDSAYRLAVSYLGNLPQDLSHRTRRGCLDIIHLFICHRSDTRGLRLLHHRHRTMLSLCSLHPQLRPNCTTLFILLGALRRSSHCGTHALAFVTSFKRRYGPQVEDDRVRRRIACLALKEGRMDVVDMMFANRVAGKRRFLQQPIGEETRGFSVRAPFREIYRKVGRENYLWLGIVKRQRRRQKMVLARYRLRKLKMDGGNRIN